MIKLKFPVLQVFVTRQNDTKDAAFSDKEERSSLLHSLQSFFYRLKGLRKF